jgi:putative membrane protein
MPDDLDAAASSRSPRRFSGEDSPRLVEPGSNEARFLKLTITDINKALSTSYATDESMPGLLEQKSMLTMTHLWGPDAWELHRSTLRWVTILLRWPQSSILHAIRVPLLLLLLSAATVIALNRLLGAEQRLTLPLAPLSLQASSIGLLLVFRNNQTHDRLKEAQRALGGMGALAREIMQILIVHAPTESSREVGLSARLLALFGWAVKSQCRNEATELQEVAAPLLPRAHRWLMGHPAEGRPAAVLLRLRAVVGGLRQSNALSSDAFKFVEERLAKLSAVDATCVRLSTFPVPPSYHRHGSRAILLWLFSLPFVLEGMQCSPIQTMLSMFATTWLLLGIDQIAIEVEQPLDVLPLHVFASGMATDVKTVLESWATMPSLPTPDDDESLLGRLPLSPSELSDTPSDGSSLRARSPSLGAAPVTSRQGSIGGFLIDRKTPGAKDVDHAGASANETKKQA